MTDQSDSQPLPRGPVEAKRRRHQLGIEEWARIHPRRRQWLMRVVTRRPGRRLFRFRSYRTELIPETGGFLIAPNHASWFDGFFFAHATPRVVRFMAKYQALDWPIVGRTIRWVGGFPVMPGERGAKGQPALEVARHVLAGGQGLIMFMEGKLVRDHDELGTARSGLAVLALQTGVPVVPAGAYGTKPMATRGVRWRPWRVPRVTIVYGEPITFELEEEPSRERIEQVRDQIWAEVQWLYAIAREIHALDPRPATYADWEART